MSQQMHFDEEQHGYQATYTPTLGENTRSYNQRAEEVQAQKIGSFSRDGSPSAGQRLALGIVSLFVLFAGMGFLTSGDTSNLFVMIAKAVGLIAVCLAIMAINYFFNGGENRN
jgi:hypothetical protein